VLLAAPYAKSPEGAGNEGSAAACLELKLSQAKPTSVLYIAMTTVMMAEFGVTVERLADDHYRVPNRG